MKTFQFNTLDDIAEHFEGLAANELHPPARTMRDRAKQQARCSTWRRAADFLRSSAVRQASPHDDQSPFGGEFKPIYKGEQP